MKTVKTLASLGLLAMAGVFCVSPLVHAADPITKSTTIKLKVEADQTITWPDDPSGTGSLSNIEATVKPGQVTNVPYAHSVTISNSTNTKYGYTLKAYGNGSGTSKNALYDGTDSIPSVSGSGVALSSSASAWGVQATFSNSGTPSNTWTGVGASSSSPVALATTIAKGGTNNTCYLSYGFAAASNVKSGNYEGKIVYSIVPNEN